MHSVKKKKREKKWKFVIYTALYDAWVIFLFKKIFIFHFSKLIFVYFFINDFEYISLLILEYFSRKLYFLLIQYLKNC